MCYKKIMNLKEYSNIKGKSHMIKSFVFIVFLFLGIFFRNNAYAFNFEGYEQEFFECLKNCTDFFYEQKLSYGKGYAQRHYDIEIKLLDKNQCFVAFREQAHTGAANASDIEIFKFPMDVLKEINKRNFSMYAKKYSVTE